MKEAAYNQYIHLQERSTTNLNDVKLFALSDKLSEQLRRLVEDLNKDVHMEDNFYECVWCIIDTENPSPSTTATQVKKKLTKCFRKEEERVF